MTNGDWRWLVSAVDQQHRDDRMVLIREISFEMTTVIEGEGSPLGSNGHNRSDGFSKGLSLNISSGGMLVLMDHSPKVERVLRVHVPTPVNRAHTPTLAEVRWTRRLPFAGEKPVCFVGLKFMF